MEEVTEGCGQYLQFLGSVHDTEDCSWSNSPVVHSITDLCYFRPLLGWDGTFLLDKLKVLDISGIFLHKEVRTEFI